MSVIVCECTICGNDLIDEEEAYGLTAGIMRQDLDGFCSSDATPWEEVICVDCMNEIDKALHTLRERLFLERSHHELNAHIRSGNPGDEPAAIRHPG